MTFELAAEVTQDTIAATLRAPNVLWQPKADGTRGQIQIRDGKVQCWTRGGHEFKELYGLGRPLATKIPHLVIDGERLDDGRYVVFDVLEGAGQDLRPLPYRTRHQILSTMPLPGMLVIPSYEAPQDKLALFKRLKEERGEGLILRDATLPWRETRGEGIRKFKFWQTASLRVRDHNVKRSVQLETSEGIYVGDCSVTNRHPLPVVGTAVEIRYLYVTTATQSIYHATYLRPRLDETVDPFASLRLKGTPI